MKTTTANMPAELRRILGLFDMAKAAYLLFKCEHVLEGQNKNLDVLLRTAEDYSNASRLLEQQGYVLYMGERVEKYKKMYVYFDGKTVSAVHLHREVAWHGVVVLDKEKIFERTQGKIPSPEDSLLIHSAHALFENFKVKDYQRKLLEKYKREVKNWKYVDLQLSKFCWKKAFYRFLPYFSVSAGMILKAYHGRLWKNPRLFFTLSNKALKICSRKISLRRKGHLISLIGMNGSGKSTTKDALLKSYEPLTNFVAGQQGYYFGWKQSSVGKIISPIFSKGNKKMFDVVSEEKVKNFDLFQEALFLLMYAKFMNRYVQEIYPHLRKNKLVVTDRYFYDLFGQYPYSEKSVVLKLLPIPKPDLLIVLDADVDTAMNRDKGGKAERIVQPREKLEGQRRRYLEVAQRNGALILSAEKDFEKNLSTIINSTWKEYLG